MEFKISEGQVTLKRNNYEQEISRETFTKICHLLLEGRRDYSGVKNISKLLRIIDIEFEPDESDDEPLVKKKQPIKKPVKKPVVDESEDEEEELSAKKKLVKRFGKKDEEKKKPQVKKSPIKKPVEEDSDDDDFDEEDSEED